VGCANSPPINAKIIAAIEETIMTTSTWLIGALASAT